MPDIWLTSYTMLTLVEQTVSLGLLALGMTVVWTAGEADLSAGSMVSLASMLSMGLIMKSGWPVWLAILVAILAGVCVGFVNGFMRTTLRIPGVIPTIGSQSAVAGLALIYGWGNMIFGSGSAMDAFTRIWRGTIGPVSIPAIILGASVFIVWFLLKRTRFGRLLYMIGGNPEASRLSGVWVNRCVVLSYVVCAMFAALSGVMMSARIGAGNPHGGADLLLEGIIAVMVGSTILAEEQEFNPIGSLVGAFFVTMVIAGTQMAGRGYHVQSILRGILLLVALTLFSMQQRATE
jgi:ribose/xylose/arabinose/galactoside ABC-type transport system permease subunit